MKQQKFQSTLPMRGATASFPSCRRCTADFNPRSPCGERRLDRHQRPGTAYFNPRSPCGERRACASRTTPHGSISIHAPHAGSDRRLLKDMVGVAAISIHAPHAGSDPAHRAGRLQSPDFNPRSPCGERQGRGGDLRGHSLISIHAPHAGSDFLAPRVVPGLSDFNPRSPCGERLENAERDLGSKSDFNPRSPCGERL